jgi:hypothetical protein
MEAKQIQMSPLSIADMLSQITELLIEMEKPISLKDAAEHMGMHPLSITRQIREGRFPAKLVHRGFDGRPKFFKSEITAFLRNR